MTITKIGHCCLLIKYENYTILTDPGRFSNGQNSITGIDLILITHEHADHIHIESLQEVLKNNPNAIVVTNRGVGKLLDEAGIVYTILEGSASQEFEGVLIEAFDGKHEEIFEDFGQVQNTGYFIANKLFYPGDSFKEPGKPVDILALPVAGSWCRIPDAVRYALAVKPKRVFPVHDALLKDECLPIAYLAPQKYLPENGIEFIALSDGDTHDFNS